MALLGQPRGALPKRLRCARGIGIVTGPPDVVLEVEVVNGAGARMVQRLPAHLRPAVEFVSDAARSGATFAPADLPTADAVEQVALCDRLRRLGVLCTAPDAARA